MYTPTCHIEVNWTYSNLSRKWPTCFTMWHTGRNTYELLWLHWLICTDVHLQLQIDVNETHPEIMYPPTLGLGGASRFLWFPHHPNVSHRLHPHLCQTLFMQYFLWDFTDSFQILRYGDHRQDFESINFSWPWLNFQGHRGYAIFTVVFAEGFQILKYGEQGQETCLSKTNPAIYLILVWPSRDVHYYITVYII